MTDTIASTEYGDDCTAGATALRLGRVERAILAALPRDGGFVPRDTVVRSAFPDAKPQDPAAMPQPVSEGRALAEAAVSRAIGSLQRKGLVVRDRNRDTGRTLLRSSAALDDPAWEQVARAEEDFAAHAAALARHWRSLSNRARERAGRVRVDRSPDGTENERRLDMELAPQGETHSAAKRLRDWRSGAPDASDRLQASSRAARDGRATSEQAPANSLRSQPGWQWLRSLRRRTSTTNSDSRGRA